MTEREQDTPGPANRARVQKDGEKWTLVLVRELRHPPEKVWRALTEPAHLREWAPLMPMDLAAAGTTVKLTTVGAPSPQVTETKVLRADAPGARVQLGRAGHPLGTRSLWRRHAPDAVAQHRSGFIAMGAAGWHICLDVLDHFLSGTPIGRIVAWRCLEVAAGSG